MSNVDRSKCSGGCPEIRSPGFAPKWRSAQSTNASTVSWVIITPLGAPVEPDVKSRWARSAGAAPGASAGAASRSARVKAAGASSIAPTTGSGPGSSASTSSSRARDPASTSTTSGSAAPTMRATREAGPAGSTGT